MDNLRFASIILLLGAIACGQNAKEKHVAVPVQNDYIRAIPGENDSIPEALSQKGEVLIAYSDCYTCHKTNTRAKGPAFGDIAARYPIQQAYVDMLANRIIAGGSGAWGSPVMLPHPDLPFKDAQYMVYYILSLKELEDNY
ncbi:MAG TPA: c-type cytochrome [Cyclobacteriaceae bacterium]|nr:c-type cytochrome [Cyclobacteriaceae bacterium]